MKTTGKIKSSLFSSIPFPILILMVWTGLILASCTEKELVYAGEDMYVKVEFDWENAPDADPEGMTLIFFPADKNSLSWRFDISGRDGGEIELLSGVYNVLTFNNDLPGLEFSNTDNFDLLSATSRIVADSLSSPTGLLYAAALSRVALFPTEEHTRIIKLQPDVLTTTYHICIDSVSGTQRIKTANAIIKGVAKSVNLQSECNSEESCCLFAQLYISKENRQQLETVTTGFGNPEIPNPSITLEIIVTTSHAKYSKTFDVTQQVMNSKHPKDVYINITGLDIPESDTPTEPDGADVGISVGVDGWQLIEIIYS